MMTSRIRFLTSNCSLVREGHLAHLASPVSLVRKGQRVPRGSLVPRAVPEGCVARKAIRARPVLQVNEGTQALKAIVASKVPQVP